MNNLSFYDYKHVTYRRSIIDQISCTNASGSTYIATSPIDEKTIQIHKILDDGSKNTIELTSTSSILSELVYLQEQKKLWLLLKDELILIDLKLEQIERMDLPEDILSAKWNTTQDVLCVYFKSGKIACCSIDFEFNELITLHEGDFNCDEMNIKNDCESESKVTIDWNYNSELFVVSCSNKAKLFNKKCELYRRIECDNVCPIVAFQPIADNMLALIIRDLNDTQGLNLIDADGLLNCRHLSFLKFALVLEMRWSPCGEFLGIYQLCNEHYFIDLILHKNLEYKQRIRINLNNLLTNFNFLKISPNMLNIQLYSQNGHYKYKYVKKILKTGWINDKAILSNINGYTLTLNFYSGSNNVTTSIINQTDYINYVIYNETLNLIAIVNSLNTVSVYKCEDLSKWEIQTSFTLENFDLDMPICHYRFYFRKKDFVGIAIQLKYDCQIIYNQSKVKRATCDKHVIYAQSLIKRDHLITNRNHRNPLIDVILLDLANVCTISLTASGVLFFNDAKIDGEFTSMHCHYAYLILTVKKEDSDGLLCLKVSSEPGFKETVAKGIFKISFYKEIEPGSVINYSIPNSNLVAVLQPDGKTNFIELMNFDMEDIAKYTSEINSKDKACAEEKQERHIRKLDGKYNKNNLSNGKTIVHMHNTLYDELNGRRKADADRRNKSGNDSFQKYRRKNDDASKYKSRSNSRNRAKRRNSKTRIDSKRIKLDHIKTDLNVIILDNTNNDRSMNSADASKLRNKILSMIDKSIALKETPPTFKEANLIKNYFHVNCVDNESLNWLVKSIDHLNDRHGKPIFRIVPQDYIQRKRLSVFIPGLLEETQKILGRLKGQNPMLDTSKWDLYHHYLDRNGMVYYIEMDLESYNELCRIDFKIYVGLDQLIFKKITLENKKHDGAANGNASTSRAIDTHSSL